MFRFECIPGATISPADDTNQTVPNICTAACHEGSTAVTLVKICKTKWREKHLVSLLYIIFKVVIKIQYSKVLCPRLDYYLEYGSHQGYYRTKVEIVEIVAVQKQYNKCVKDKYTTV